MVTLEEQEWERGKSHAAVCTRSGAIFGGNRAINHGLQRCAKGRQEKNRG